MDLLLNKENNHFQTILLMDLFEYMPPILLTYVHKVERGRDVSKRDKIWHAPLLLNPPLLHLPAPVPPPECTVLPTPCPWSAPSPAYLPCSRSPSTAIRPFTVIICSSGSKAAVSSTLHLLLDGSVWQRNSVLLLQLCIYCRIGLKET